MFMKKNKDFQIRARLAAFKSPYEKGNIVFCRPVDLHPGILLGILHARTDQLPRGFSITAADDDPL